MFNWFDLMRQAQTQAAFETLARQYQLSGDQQQRALAAFLPAFAMGLQHAMTRGDASRFLQSLMGTGYQTFWQAATHSLTPQVQQEGRRLLDQLFGSDEACRRVAHQAADFAGIGVEIMQQILPIYAGLLAGGLAQWMGAQSKVVQGFAPPNAGEGSGPGAANPWADLWAGWLKAGEAQKKAAGNPFEELMAGMFPTPEAEKPHEPQPAPSAPWDEMVEQGREMQMQYLTSLQRILEDAWGTDPKKA